MRDKRAPHACAESEGDERAGEAKSGREKLVQSDEMRVWWGSHHFHGRHSVPGDTDHHVLVSIG